MAETLGWRVEVVQHPAAGLRDVRVAPGQPPPEAAPKGFPLLPRRWVVERTFAWLGRNCHLAKDREGLCATGEARIDVAMSRFMARRLAP